LPKEKVVSVEDIELLRGQIEAIALDRLKNYLGKDETQLIAMKPEVLRHILQQAKISLQYEKEMNVNNRVQAQNYIRVFKIVAEDKKELRKLIKKKLPEYFE
jgi:hypothetical protein